MQEEAGEEEDADPRRSGPGRPTTNVNINLKKPYDAGAKKVATTRSQFSHQFIAIKTTKQTLKSYKNVINVIHYQSLNNPNWLYSSWTGGVARPGGSRVPPSLIPKFTLCQASQTHQCTVGQN